MDELNLSQDVLAQRDFEYLNKVIFEKSGIHLSTATLRRIWSSEHDGVPQTKTLDALAQALGHTGWHEFKKMHPQQVNSGSFPLKKVSQLLIIVVTLAGAIAFWHFWNPFVEVAVSLVPEKTSHEGVPATIGFNYDISSVNKEVKIQLSWNPYEQAVLDPSKNFYTGTYFYPDYHEAKLLLDDEIIASSYVHITTPGWHGLIMKSGLDPSPIYVEKSDLQKKGKLAISTELSNKYEFEQLNELFSVFTLSSKMLEQVNGDDFELKTSFRSIEHLSNRICNQTDIVIKGATGSLRIPISSEGCYGITNLKCSEVLISGKTSDLSSLSIDLLQTQAINLRVKENELSIRLGEEEPFSLNYTQPIGQLKVVKLIFTGYGEVEAFKISSRGVALTEKIEPF